MIQSACAEKCKRLAKLAEVWSVSECKCQSCLPWKQNTKSFFTWNTFTRNINSHNSSWVDDRYWPNAGNPTACMNVPMQIQHCVLLLYTKISTLLTPITGSRFKVPAFSWSNIHTVCRFHQWLLGQGENWPLLCLIAKRRNNDNWFFLCTTVSFSAFSKHNLLT